MQKPSHRIPMQMRLQRPVNKMGTALFQIKVMPESPEIDLELIKEKIKENIQALDGKVANFEEQPVAFGLKALIVSLSINESVDSTKIEDAISQVEHVSSIDIIDYRRALE